jgi:hypothetical protein
VVKHCTNRTHGYLSNCAWPKGGAVTIGRHTADQANMPWSGVEYAVAAHLMLMGMEDESLGVMRDVWERQERAGLRFNHIECGEHYYRALSSWAVYLAWCGFSLDVPAGEISLKPRAGTWQAVFNTATAWGTVRRTGPKALRIEVVEGTLEFSSLLLKGVAAVSAEVKLGEVVAETRTHRAKECLRIVCAEKVKVGAGGVVTAKWR